MEQLKVEAPLRQALLVVVDPALTEGPAEQLVAVRGVAEVALKCVRDTKQRIEERVNSLCEVIRLAFSRIEERHADQEVELLLEEGIWPPFRRSTSR